MYWWQSVETALENLGGRHIIFSAVGLLSLTGVALADAETSVNNAYKVCFVFDGISIITEPCDVSGWGKSVNVRIDTNAGEARLLCSTVVTKAREKGWSFDAGWTLKVYSPYSGDNTIAYCAL